MPALALFLLIFIGIPLIEIYLLIEIGSEIGAFTTVFAVVFTAVLGVALIRIQGFSTLQKAQVTMNQGGVPALEMFEGVMLLFAAVCLLIPGFFTDTVGFLLLIPPLRHFLASRLVANNASFSSRFKHQNGDYLEGEYEELTPEQQHLKNKTQTEKHYIIEGQVDSDEKK